MNRTKKTLTSLSALACSALCFTASAQDRNYDPPLGSKTLYQSGKDTDAPAPPGYSPFFINYVGRHGARHATGGAEFGQMERCLKEAADAGALRPDGLRLYRMIRAIVEVEKKYTPGTLTAVGESEQYTIGKDMGERYPNVVRRPEDCLEVTTTPETRTVQSAEQFLKGLSSPSGCVTRTSNDSIRLRFFSLSPAYSTFVKKGDWHTAQTQLEDADAYRQINHAIVHRLFDSVWAEKLIKGEQPGFNRPDAFITALYSAAVITPGLREELKALGYQPQDTDVFSLLSAHEAETLNLVDDARDFYVKGPGLDSMGIQVRVAAPLLADFIQSSDHWIASGKTGADLRFAHAETIAPIAALMDCEGAATSTSDAFHYPTVWHADRVMGYSANIQWIFYRATTSDDCLVKILYNERPIHLPVPTTNYPYYSWKAVKEYYLHKLHTLGADGSRDMYAWLQQLK